MNNFKEFLIILWGGFFLYLFFEIIFYLKYRYHLKRLKSTPLKKELKQYIKNLPHYKNLSPKQKSIIEYKIQRCLEEKVFKGVYIDLNDEMKVIISFFAALMTLSYEEFCYDNLEEILIYPHTIIKEEKGYLKEKILISGEAIKDIVVLSWDEIKRDLKTLKRNVIIHEFAHILDFEDGMADGIPPMDEKMKKEWKKTILEKYKELNHSNHLFIDSYALTNEAEFFAVISEYFFMQPKKLKLHYPIIYNELKKFYKIDPIKILE